MRQSHDSRITSDGGLLAYLELEEAFGLTDMRGERLADARTENGCRRLAGLLRQSILPVPAMAPLFMCVNRFGNVERWQVGPVTLDNR